jgi:hypothetical protein
MTDEIAKKPPAVQESELKEIAIQEALKVTQDVTSTGSAGANKIQASSNNKLEHEYVQQVPHFHCRWHADAIVDGHENYQGIVKDISMRGVNFIVAHNLQNSKLIKLQIHIPPLVASTPQHVLEVSGKITSTVYDSDEDSFRSGINFEEFTLATDRAFLLSRIAGQ